MPRIIQFRRGTTADLAGVTGAEGEIFIDLDLKTIRIQDGVTAGGFALLSDNTASTLVADQATQDNRIAVNENDIDLVESRMTTAEASILSIQTNYAQTANLTSIYRTLADSYSQTQVDSLLTTLDSNLTNTLTTNYYNKTEVYAKSETDTQITNATSVLALSADLANYRLVADSYTKAETNYQITTSLSTYYTKADSDSLYRTQADSYTNIEVDNLLSTLRGDMYDRTYIDSTYYTKVETYSKTEMDNQFRTIDDSFTKAEVLSEIQSHTPSGIAQKVNVIEDTTNDTVTYDFAP
jgi:hypothetical protein